MTSKATSPAQQIPDQPSLDQKTQNPKTEPAPVVDVLLFGPSGCGKTSLLQALTGTVAPGISHWGLGPNPFANVIQGSLVPGTRLRVFDSPGFNELEESYTTCFARIVQQLAKANVVPNIIVYIHNAASVSHDERITPVLTAMSSDPFQGVYLLSNLPGMDAKTTQAKIEGATNLLAPFPKIPLLQANISAKPLATSTAPPSGLDVLCQKLVSLSSSSSAN